MDEEGPKNLVAKYLNGVKNGIAKGRIYRNDVGRPPFSTHRQDRRRLSTAVAAAAALAVDVVGVDVHARCC